MTETATISVRLLEGTIDCAVGLGLERRDIVQRAGLASLDFENPDGRAPLVAAVQLSTVLREMLGPTAAMRLAQTSAIEKPTVLGYLVENCQTLGHALRTIQRYRSIVLDLTPPALSVSGDLATFGCTYPAAFVASAPDAIELMATYWLTRARNITRVDWNPVAVNLQGPQTDAQTYRDVFRCAVTNDANRTELVFAASLLELPVPGADPTLRHYLKPIADQIMQRLPQRDGFVQKVQSTIASMLKDGDSHLDTVARSLSISPRTLQRRLEEQQLTFSNVLDDARRVAALEYLEDKRVSIADTAYLLGFSEPSTFYRAFKRWTGTSPAAYRRTVLT